MATVKPIRGDWPQITIKIEASGSLDLGNVARLFERLNTGIHRAYSGQRPRIEIVSLENGSIELRVAIVSAVLTAGQVAYTISDHLQNNPPASRACNDVFQNDNGNRILIVGGERTIIVSPDDISGDLEFAVSGRVTAAHSREPEYRAIRSVAEGVFQGTLERISGEYYIQLTDRPGLYLRVQDEREDPAPWEDHQSYRVEGRAYFAPAGRLSAFIVESAIQL